MKILFFARLFYPHIGGVEKHLFEISTRLTAMGHEVTIVTESLLGEKQHEKKRWNNYFSNSCWKKSETKKVYYMELAMAAPRAYENSRHYSLS